VASNVSLFSQESEGSLMGFVVPGADGPVGTALKRGNHAAISPAQKALARPNDSLLPPPPFICFVVYFNSVAVKRTRDAVALGLCTVLAGVIAAVVICCAMFG